MPAAWNFEKLNWWRWGPCISLAYEFRRVLAKLAVGLEKNIDRSRLWSQGVFVLGPYRKQTKPKRTPVFACTARLLSP
jgi:hypothetical protein